MSDNSKADARRTVAMLRMRQQYLGENHRKMIRHIIVKYNLSDEYTALPSGNSSTVAGP